jgi:hypothetical protein
MCRVACCALRFFLHCVVDMLLCCFAVALSVSHKQPHVSVGMSAALGLCLQVCALRSEELQPSWQQRITGTQGAVQAWQYVTCCARELGEAATVAMHAAAALPSICVCHDAARQ